MLVRKYKIGLRSLFNQKGVGLIDSMIAAGIVSASALALGTSFVKVGQARAKTQTVATAVAMESALLESLNNPDTYDMMIDGRPLKDYMAQGQSPNFSIPLQGFPSSVPADGEPHCFGTSGQSVNATSFSNNNCRIIVQVGLMYEAATMAYRYAYRIDVNPNLVTMGRLGQASGWEGSGENMQPDLTPADYTQTIPLFAYANNFNALCRQEEGFLGVQAFNRDTGQVTCFEEPKTSCPNGTLPKRLRYDVNTNSIELVCETTQEIGCPIKYALNQFSPVSLIRGNPKSGTCVYIAERRSSYPNLLGPSTRDSSLYGVVCPTDYRFNSAASTCRVAPGTAVSTPGSCRDDNWVNPTCTTTQDLARGVETECCTYQRQVGYTQVAARSGSARFVPQANPRAALCQLYIPRQICGSRWTASVDMRVTCDLAVAETESVR